MGVWENPEGRFPPKSLHKFAGRLLLRVVVLVSGRRGDETKKEKIIPDFPPFSSSLLARVSPPQLSCSHPLSHYTICPSSSGEFLDSIGSLTRERERGGKPIQVNSTPISLSCVDRWPEQLRNQL